MRAKFRPVKCLYVDLDGTLLGPGASLLRAAGGGFSLDSVRALQACDRAGVEVVIYSGRRQSSVFECARLIGSSAYIFEIGCGLVVDGELEWLTDGLEPREGASIYDQITATGAPARLLEHYAGRLEVHTPWHRGREVSHLFRGLVDTVEANALVAGDGLRVVDNGVINMSLGEIQFVHVYHLIPAGASKARGVARHMQARAYRREDCIAVGDSREDLEAAGVVGMFWLVANASERDPTLHDEIAGRPGIRIADGTYGAGVYEAVITTLAERR
jgi:hydroxymethylpyrimidine pyrophosphatase-like HAD family hydrolase